MKYGLPKSVSINGKNFDIVSDYRDILEIIEILNDSRLTNQEKGYLSLLFFYPGFSELHKEDYDEALRQCFQFIDCGEVPQNGGKSKPQLVDWEKDFRYIVAPVNHIIGKEIRDEGYLHWWTFVSAYMEIGDCTFSNIVRIRDLKSRGKPLDKRDQEWYRRNKKIVDIEKKYTKEDDAFFGGFSGSEISR